MEDRHLPLGSPSRTYNPKNILLALRVGHYNDFTSGRADCNETLFIV